MTRAGPVALRLKENHGLRRSAILMNVNGHLSPSKGGIGFRRGDSPEPRGLALISISTTGRPERLFTKL